MYRDRRKILYVITSLDIGGAENHLTQVVVALKTRGWQPEIYVIKPGGPFTSFLNLHKIPIHGMVLPQWLDKLLINKSVRAWFHIVISILWLIYIILVRRPYIIHFFLPASYIVGGIAALITRVPMRIMSRRSLNHYQKNHKFLKHFEHYLHRHMSMISGNSQAVIKDLENEGIAPSKLRLIYNGIDMSLFTQPFARQCARADAGITEGTLVLVMVANIIPYKGHTDLIAALSTIKDLLPQPWQLLCLGRDDGIGVLLKQQAVDCGIAQNITWLGCKYNVSDYLRMADIGILSSHQEGFSNAVLEGAAAGLPLVVTDVGGNAEVVIDGKTGYVVPVKNIVKLSTAILQVAQDVNRMTMGHLGKQRVTTLFSMKACIDAYEELYNVKKIDTFKY